MIGVKVCLKPTSLLEESSLLFAHQTHRCTKCLSSVVPQLHVKSALMLTGPAGIEPQERLADESSASLTLGLLPRAGRASGSASVLNSLPGDRQVAGSWITHWVALKSYTSTSIRVRLHHKVFIHGGPL